MQRIFIALLCVSTVFLYACDHSRRTQDVVRFAEVHSYKVSAYPAIFETAFFDSTKAPADSIREFFAVDIGKLNVETGKIVAGDPILLRDLGPFEQPFPVGQFPVQLSIARYNSDDRVAFSRSYFSTAPVTKWEFALESGQTQIPIGSDSIYGFGVDAGIAVYIDAKAKLAYKEMDDKDARLWDKIYIQEMGTHQHMTWDYTLHPFGGHNIACFSTGLGDGFYASYVGYDSTGQICRLLTDFGLVNWADKKH